MAETYELADTDPRWPLATSGLIDEPVNRFLHVTEDVSDVVAQNQMQRRLGQRTGTCFQRCVGMDAINALFSVTFDIDAASGTSYHQRFRTWLADVQRQNLVVGGAMTDPKGDRSLPRTSNLTPTCSCMWWAKTRTASSSAAPRHIRPVPSTPTGSWSCRRSGWGVRQRLRRCCGGTGRPRDHLHLRPPGQR